MILITITDIYIWKRQLHFRTITSLKHKILKKHPFPMGLGKSIYRTTCHNKTTVAALIKKRTPFWCSIVWCTIILSNSLPPLFFHITFVCQNAYYWLTCANFDWILIILERKWLCQNSKKIRRSELFCMCSVPSVGQRVSSSVRWK